jgi:hypothetical protein
MSTHRPVDYSHATMRTAATVGLLAGLLAVAAETFIRYSGHVTDVDLHRGVVVVEELGRRGLPVRHEVRVSGSCY